MRRLLFTGAVCAVLLCPASRSVLAEGPGYTITNLGTFSGVVPFITGINASGAVSGWVHTGLGDRALRYTDSGGWALIPGLESITSYAFGINDHGDVVGTALLANGDIRAFRYTDGGSVEFVAPLDGGRSTQGYGISNTGEMTGYGDKSNFTTVAFRQMPGLLAQPIDAFGSSYSAGCGINDSGQVAGSFMTPDNLLHGFRANVDGTVAEISGLNGPESQNFPCAIDGDGNVTGQAETATGALHAFLFSSVNPLDLDSFGSTGSAGIAISNGVVVGTYTLPDNVSTHAFRYDRTTGTVDLNTLLPSASGWVLTDGGAVNAKGVMAGQGTLNGASAAWKLSPPSDTTPPTIAALSVSPSALKPDHKMTPVVVSVSATDDVDPHPSCSITAIDATDGDPGDAAITGPLTASVLSAKDARGNTRVYTLTVTCSDASRNPSTGTVTVQVAGNGASKALTRIKGD
jgi:probable HAF family extracellular repeat protein